MISTDDCWLYACYKSERGYGVYSVKIDGKWRSRKVHSLMYETFVGEIPEGLVLDHLCKITSCINPSHLEPVTPSENTKRADNVIERATKKHCPQGHPYAGTNLKLAKVGKYIFRYCRICSNASKRRYRQRHRRSKKAVSNL